MNTKSKTRRDFSRIAFAVAQITTGDAEPTPELTGKKLTAQRAAR